MRTDDETGSSTRGSPRPRVVGVSLSTRHGFTKEPALAIRLLTGLGVEGDAHLGRTVQHRSRVRRDPTQPNLRQVHLIGSELFEEVRTCGHHLTSGALGENVTTTGLDLLALPTGVVLGLGDTAEVEVTGLRNPCRQIEDFQDGLLGQVLWRATDGGVVRRAGVMGIVRRGGEVRPGDLVTVELPRGPHRGLEPV